MSADFKWYGEDSDSVVIQEQPQTAVYSTTGGQIAVRQPAPMYQEDDVELYFNPQGALAVAWALIEQAHLIGLPSPSVSLMVESEHWPPVSRRTDEPAKLGPRVSGESEPGPLLRGLENGPDGDDLLATAANPTGRQSPTMAAE